MRDELYARDIKIKETETRLEGELNGLRLSMETVRVSGCPPLLGALCRPN